MKKLAITLVLLIVFLMSLSTAELWHYASLRKRAMLLKPGDTKADVHRVLGRPTRVFVPPPLDTNLNFLVWLLSVNSETWAYGNRFDLRSVFYGEWPVRLRLFSPDSNDVVVVFGSSNRVAQVAVPNDVP